MKKIAIILAGGIGRRFNVKTPKQFVDIENKPLIIHTLEKFENNLKVDEIIVVCLNSYIQILTDMIKTYGISKVVDVISGGDTRHQSIRNAVNYLAYKHPKNTKIIIHNANMPLVTQKNINECFEKCLGKDTIVTTAAICDGFFYEKMNGNNQLSIGPDRNDILHAKVPEALYLSTALNLYNDEELFDKKYESYTAGMLGIIKNKVVVPVICESTNKKITTMEDYYFIQTHLRKEKENEQQM